jgi:hypothetical protein
MPRLSRSVASLLAAGLTLVVLPALARAQSRDTVHYNWTTNDLVALPRVASGSTLLLRITGLNQFCYDYQVTINQVESAHNLPDILKFLSGGLDSAAVPAVPPGDTKSDPLAELVSTSSEAEQRLAAAESAQNKAHEAMTSAVKALNAIVAAATRVKERVAAFEKAACPGGGSRGPAAGISQSLSDLTTAVKALVTLLPGRSRADSLLTAAAMHLEDARLDERLVGRAGDARSVAFRNVNSSRISNLDKGLDALEDELKKTREGTLQQVKNIDASAITTALAHDSTAMAQDSIQRVLVVNDNTDSILVAIKATGKESISSVKGAVIDGGFTVPVRRRHRMFLSAGFMFSTLDEHSYRRSNRLVPGQPDSTFSTFIDRSNNRNTAFAPIFLVNMTLGRWLGTDLVVSGGVARRKVADDLGPDFLAGLSFGVSDKLVVSVLGGMGRVERLLLGDPRSVKKRPVPAAIEFESAVGRQWKGQLAVAVSYRTR